MLLQQRLGVPQSLFAVQDWHRRRLQRILEVQLRFFPLFFQVGQVQPVLVREDLKHGNRLQGTRNQVCQRVGKNDRKDDRVVA